MMSKSSLSRRNVLVGSSALAAATLLSPAAADAMERLVWAAKEEGQLTVSGLARDWCGYGAIIDGFKARYGLLVNELDPNSESEHQLEAIRNTTPKTPDVIEVGLSFGPSAKRQGLLQPYRVSTWDSIPGAAKDADGYWYGDYYGLPAFEVNADIIGNYPRDWADLLNPEYKNAVALAGDPSGSAQAVQGVFAAGHSAGADAENAASRGLEFFARLKEEGNFVPIIGDGGTLSEGVTPILIRWDHLARGDRDRLKGHTNVEVIAPRTGIVAGIYVQAISAHARHPNAALLWMEYLYSDDIQLAWLRSHCHPIRLSDLVSNGKVPVALVEELPETRNYGRGEAYFPTEAQQERAKDIITNGWDDVVGVKVQCYQPNGPTSAVPAEVADSVSPT
jgi:putative spermidine/putrescine transport system substrate-binding protein